MLIKFHSKCRSLPKILEKQLRESFTAIRYHRSTPSVLVGNFCSKTRNRAVAPSAVGSDVSLMLDRLCLGIPVEKGTIQETKDWARLGWTLESSTLFVGFLKRTKSDRLAHLRLYVNLIALLIIGVLMKGHNRILKTSGSADLPLEMGRLGGSIFTQSSFSLPLVHRGIALSNVSFPRIASLAPSDGRFRESHSHNLATPIPTFSS